MECSLYLFIYPASALQFFLSSLGLVRFGPERPGSRPNPPGSKPGRINNGRSVRYGLECKPVNPGLFPPLWPGTETDPPTSGTYPGDGAARDSRLATKRHEATARGIARGHDGAARGDGDHFPSNVRVLRRLLAGNASPSSPLPHSLPGARVLACLRSIRR